MDTLNTLGALAIPKPVLYLDIDGTVRHGKDELGYYVSRPEDVVIFPEAVVMMAHAKACGFRIVGISNQGGIALGLVNFDDVARAMIKTNELCNGLFDLIQFCRHHPDAENPELAHCWCRKPRAGLIIEAAIDMSRRYNEYYPPFVSLMVGDRPEDKACAEAANVKFMWAKDWRAASVSILCKENLSKSV